MSNQHKDYELQQKPMNMHEESAQGESVEVILSTSERPERRGFSKKIIMFASTVTVIAAMVILVVAVNISPTLAFAFERIPILGQFTTAVNFSTSLTAAIDNEFIQPINLEQTINDITMRVEYVIVDQRHLNIFYTLDSPVYFGMMASHFIYALEDGEPYPIPVQMHSTITMENRAMNEIAVRFFDQVPDSIVLEAHVRDNGATRERVATMPVPVPTPAPMPPDCDDLAMPEPISTFSFTLEFDPLFTATGEIFPLYYDFEIDGQRFTITTVGIYPTYMEINLEADPANTAIMQSTRFFVEDERGRRYNRISGISSIGSTGHYPWTVSHRLKSPFFAQSNHLTLFIEEIEWTDEDRPLTRVDLANVTAEHLPQGVRIVEARYEWNSWHLTFAVEERAEYHSHQIFHTTYYDENGNEFHFNSWATGSRGFFDEEVGEWVDTRGEFRVQFSLFSFPYHIVYLTPVYTRAERFEDPIGIRIK